MRRLRGKRRLWRKAIPRNRPSTRRSQPANRRRRAAGATVCPTPPGTAQKAIKAPFAGRLGLRNVDLGQYVAVGTSLVTLQQLDPIYADFPVPEEALRSLAVGQFVRMTVDAIPGRSFAGKIEA